MAADSTRPVRSASNQVLTTEGSQTRSCANCACFARMLPDGTMTASTDKGQPVCRRNTPGGRYVNADVPVFDAKGNPIMDAKGHPRLERRQVLQIGYPAVTPEAVCWDGWRPIEARPGEMWPWSRARRQRRAASL